MANIFSKLFKSKSSIEKKGKNGYSDKEIRNLVRNKAILKRDLGHQSRDIIKDVPHYSIPGADSCDYIDFLEKNGLSDFSYKGYHLKSRHTFLWDILESDSYVNTKTGEMEYPKYRRNMRTDLKSKHIKFIKDGIHVSYKHQDMKQIRVSKREKEQFLETQYNHLKNEIDDIYATYKIDTQKTDSAPIFPTTYRHACIRDNVLTTYDSLQLEDFLNRGYESYRRLYGDYLTRKLDEIRREFEGEMFGRLGEENVIQATNEFDNCIALHNIQLPATNNNGESYIFEIDTLLITTRGIFVLEVKNYGLVGGYELIVDSTGRWATYYPKTETEITRENPNKQNNMHVINFNKFINKHAPQFNRSIDALGVIVIGNDDVKIKQENPVKNLKRVDELYNYIKDFENIIYTAEQIEEIADIVKKHNITTEKKYPINCIYEEVLDNLSFIKEDLNFLETAISSAALWPSNPSDGRREDAVPAYLKEQMNNYNYKFIEKESVSFSRDFGRLTFIGEQMYDTRSSENNEIYIYPIDIIKPEFLK